MSNTHRNKCEQLVVVEAFEPCKCHVAVTLRCRDRRHWIFMFVKQPVAINFGDIVHAQPNEQGLFLTDYFWLDRGPKQFRLLLQLDDYPEPLLKKQIAECAGNFIGNNDEPPQMEHYKP